MTNNLISKDAALSLLLMHENNLRASGKDQEADGIRTAYADIDSCCKPVKGIVPCDDQAERILRYIVTIFNELCEEKGSHEMVERLCQLGASDEDLKAMRFS